MKHPIFLPNRRHALLAAASLACAPMAFAQAATVEDDTWTDAQRSRTLPVRIRWPSDALPVSQGGRPVVLFSHGLGGSRAGGTVWGEAWAAAGFVVVHLQHPGSDFDAVRLPGGLREAMRPQQLLARVLDVRFALDEIGRRRSAGGAHWSGVRPDAVGMSGHSYGAHTTLGIAGQAYPGMAPMNEPRLVAFIAFSPSVPQGGDARRAFAAITRPMLCLTGTLDGDVIGNGSTPEQRRAVYEALPAGHKAGLVLKDADHMTFAGQTLETGARAAQIARHDPRASAVQPQQHALVAALTTDWWRAQLMNDAQARARLAQPQGLGPEDSWQMG